MSKRIGLIALIVREYDEAIAFFTQSLGFDLIEDTPRGDGKRWVVVAPKESPAHGILLARAVTPEQSSRIGNQTGGRVFLFLCTTDFWVDYQAMKSKGVVFEAPPRQEDYGAVAVFKDLYGNRWDLLEAKP